MLRLLKLEWHKFRNNNVVILLCSFYILLLPTVIFIGKELENLPPPLPSNSIFFEFPTVWDWMAYSGSWLVFFFLGFVALYLVTSEISYKTQRQNIITGLTRKDYYLSKVYAILAISLVATIYFAIVTITIGVFHAEHFSLTNVFDNNNIFRYLLMCLGYMSFGLFIGFLVKRSSLATFIYLSYILFIEAILKWQLHFNIVSNKSVNYWPLNAIEDLTPNPAYQMGEFVIKKGLDFDFVLSNNEAIIASSIYILIFLFLGFFTFKVRDI